MQFTFLDKEIKINLSNLQIICRCMTAILGRETWLWKRKCWSLYNFHRHIPGLSFITLSQNQNTTHEFANWLDSPTKDGINRYSTLIRQSPVSTFMLLPLRQKIMASTLPSKAVQQPFTWWKVAQALSTIDNSTHHVAWVPSSCRACELTLA